MSLLIRALRSSSAASINISSDNLLHSSSDETPEPYKGKGIRYENEFVRKKAGKAAKGKTA